MKRTFFIPPLLLSVVIGCSLQTKTVSQRSESTPKVEQDVTIVKGVVWKTTPDGLAMGISHARDLIVKVHFENKGKNDIAGLIRSPARFILELNGKYYAMSDHGGKSSFMPSGRSYGPLTIDLTKFWEIPKLTQHYTVEPNDSHPILKKEKNTLRLHYKMEDKLIPSGKLIVEK